MCLHASFVVLYNAGLAKIKNNSQFCGTNDKNLGNENRGIEMLLE